jgi:N-acetylmuramic acid 6-phosphate etherase
MASSWPAEADRFVDEETQFQLGFLPTEQSNPLTVDFHAATRRSTRSGIECLLAVDRVMAEFAARLLCTDKMEALRHSILRVFESDARIFFAGCGASGRMAAQLEAMWRRAFREAAESSPSLRKRCLELAGRAASVISGGELAIIRSVEYFEDHRSFGRRQVRDAGVRPGDLFITLGEAGIAWATIGMALAADDIGAQGYFFYCNPRPLMEERLERCRELFSRKGIRFLEAAIGPMALTGSTRMQATSIELVCIGGALEWAFATWANSQLDWASAESPRTFGRTVATLIGALAETAAVSGLAAVVEAETDVYRRGGLVTYHADRYLVDILGDTTERTATFALPPLPCADRSEEPSWAYAKNPRFPTPEAWQDLLQRPPVGIDWDSTVYRELGAPQALIDAPPLLDLRACHAYAIGNEPDPSRTSRHPSLLFGVHIDDDGAPPASSAPAFGHRATLRIGGEPAGAEPFSVPASIPSGPLSVARHLAVKLVFNLVSTTTAALLDRIRGNWMVQVLPTNKKLIDRSIRILAELGALPYRHAAHLFFETWHGMPVDERHAKSPVAAALSRLPSRY